MTPMQLATLLADWATKRTDTAPDWSDDVRDGIERAFDPDAGDVCEDGEADECGIERDRADAIVPARAPAFPVVDVERRAATARYKGGAIKRTRYPAVDLSKRVVLIGLHQMGVERAESSSRWPLVTAHRVIGPTGRRYRVHPLRTRLVAINRLDRAPWHTISIEVAGNFEGEDGSGNWWMPKLLGRGRAGEAQLLALRQEIVGIVHEVAELGARVVGIVPHRVAGKSSKTGKPNRQICCGSRVWSEGGERAARELRLQTPAPGWAIGGLPVPESWRGPWADPTLATLGLRA